MFLLICVWWRMLVLFWLWLICWLFLLVMVWVWLVCVVICVYVCSMCKCSFVIGCFLENVMNVMIFCMLMNCRIGWNMVVWCVLILFFCVIRMSVCMYRIVCVKLSLSCVSGWIRVLLFMFVVVWKVWLLVLMLFLWICWVKLVCMFWLNRIVIVVMFIDDFCWMDCWFICFFFYGM